VVILFKFLCCTGIFKKKVHVKKQTTQGNNPTYYTPRRSRIVVQKYIANFLSGKLKLPHYTGLVAVRSWRILDFAKWRRRWHVIWG
jgi:hypothetical protein